MSEERVQGLPLARVACLDGCASVDGTKVVLLRGGLQPPCALLENALGSFATSMCNMLWYTGCDDACLAQVTDCAVCLEPFGKGEEVRQLPQCAHVFHRPCVDRWLRMHSACPLCRTPL